MYNDRKSIIVRLTDLQEGWEMDKTPETQVIEYEWQIERWTFERSIDWRKIQKQQKKQHQQTNFVFNKIIPQNGVIRIWTEQAPSNAVNRSYQWIFDPTTIASGTSLWGVSLIFRETVLWIEFDGNNAEQTKYVKIVQVNDFEVNLSIFTCFWSLFCQRFLEMLLFLKTINSLNQKIG